LSDRGEPAGNPGPLNDGRYYERIKKNVARGVFIYYSYRQKELKITALKFRTLLFFFSVFITFPSVVSAAVSVKEKTAEEYRLKGFEAQKNGDLDKALSWYVKAAELGTKDAAVYNDIGVIYEQLGVADKALSNYQQSLKIDSQYLPVYSNLAYLYKKRGDYNQAAFYFKKRIEMGNPADPWTDRAKEELSVLGQKIPGLKKWLIEQEAIDLNREMTKKARAAFYRRVFISKEHFKKGQTWQAQKRYREALEEYNLALSLTPDNPTYIAARNKVRMLMTKEEAKGHADMAMQLLETGDTASAEMELRRALATIPKEPAPISNDPF